MKKTLLAVAITSLSLSSCATIFTGTKDEITFNSSPEGATVFHRGVEKCTTPCTTSLNRSLNPENVDLKMIGYEPKTVGLSKEFNAVTLLNILLGGIIGLGVDAATGSLTKYDQKKYNIELKPTN
jgi:hypothetical protein